jgi:4'-phosphopantetheinyl transferase EntD
VIAITEPHTVFERVGRRLADALGGAVGVACSGIASDTSLLYPEEREAVSRAVPKRQREFATGRTNARLAMARIGETPTAIPSGPDRAPVWPAHLVGSISHTDRACVAVVARRSQVGAIGIDLENDAPLEDKLWPIICTPAELAQVASLPIEQRGRQVTRLFSAKEAVYKWQYPLTGCVLGFQQIQLKWLPGPSGQRFVVALKGSSGLSPPEGYCFNDEGLVVSWVHTI